MKRELEENSVSDTDTMSIINSSFRLLSVNTRSSADADNGLDAFSGQSRSTNIVPFHITYSFLLCNSNFVFKKLRRAVFTIFDFKKCRDLEMGSKVTQGH